MAPTPPHPRAVIMPASCRLPGRHEPRIRRHYRVEEAILFRFVPQDRDNGRGVDNDRCQSPLSSYNCSSLSERYLSMSSGAARYDLIDVGLDCCNFF
jgi:hypothetical protein